MDHGTDRTIRRAAIAAIISLLVILTTTAIVIIRPDTRDWVREQLHWAPRGFVVGEASELPAAWFDGRVYTVVIFATANCDACRRALPFHQQLARATDDAPNIRARIVLTSPADDAKAYAGMMGVSGDRVETMDVRGTKLRRVPTILILDQRGVVVEVKEGVLPDVEQRALMERVKALR